MNANKLTHNKKKQLGIRDNTNYKDLTGKVFFKLLVLGLDHKREVRNEKGQCRTLYYWKCICDCGNEVIRSGNSLRRGATKSCGCYKIYRQMLMHKRKKHIKAKERSYEEEIEI